MGMAVVISIGVTGGVDAVFGPFKTHDDALQWASLELKDTWCIMPLIAQDGQHDR